VAILVLALVLATAAVYTQSAYAQLGNGKPPISVVGNPHGFSTGPAIPICSVFIHQANGPIEGCRGTP
jgi:hypothetical protein